MNTKTLTDSTFTERKNETLKQSAFMKDQQLL